MAQETTTDGASSPTDGRFLLNAVVGAVAGLVLGFVPLSPGIGGAMAGYLQGGSRGDGLRVGAVAGLPRLPPMTTT